MRALLAAVCIAALTACGGTSAPVAGTDREWVANTSGVINELERDLLLAGSAGDTVAAARHALTNQSNLYTVLVAYTDFAGCNHMVSTAGTPSARYEGVERTLVATCTLLERASVLFTQAVTSHDAHTLLKASQTTLRASPLLVRAKAELERAGQS